MREMGCFGEEVQEKEEGVEEIPARRKNVLEVEGRILGEEKGCGF